MSTAERTRSRSSTETPPITRVHVSGPNAGRMLALYFEGGECRAFDVGRLIHKGGVFASLRDYSLFEAVAVLPYGRGVEWPSGADLSRDTLYLDSVHVGHIAPRD